LKITAAKLNVVLNGTAVVGLDTGLITNAIIRTYHYAELTVKRRGSWIDIPVIEPPSQNMTDSADQPTAAPTHPITQAPIDGKEHSIVVEATSSAVVRGKLIKREG